MLLKEHKTIYTNTNRETSTIRKVFKVISKYNDKFLVKDPDDNHCEYIADVASSCILIPCEGDIVSAIVYKDELYIECILKRESVEPKKFKLQGEVEAGLDESKIQITPQRISINSNNLSLISKITSITSKISKWLIDGLDIKSKLIKHNVENQQIICEEKYEIKAKNKSEEIEELNYSKSSATIQRSDDISVTTNKFNINT